MTKSAFDQEIDDLRRRHGTTEGSTSPGAPSYQTYQEGGDKVEIWSDMASLSGLGSRYTLSTNLESGQTRSELSGMAFKGGRGRVIGMGDSGETVVGDNLGPRSEPSRSGPPSTAQVPVDAETASPGLPSQISERSSQTAPDHRAPQTDKTAQSSTQQSSRKQWYSQDELPASFSMTIGPDGVTLGAPSST